MKDEELSIDEIWGEAEISKKDVTIHRLRIQHDVHTVLLKGHIVDYPLLKKSKADIKGEATIYFNGIKDIISLPELIKLDSGSSHLVFNVGMFNKEFKGNFSASIRDLRSNIVFADTIDFAAEFEQNKLILQSLDFKYNEESIKLLKPATVADFTREMYLGDKISAHVEKVSLNNAAQGFVWHY
jgi:hypothetical protein